MSTIFNLTEDIFLHKLPQEILENNFCEQDWTILYKLEKEKFGENDSIEIYREYLTYLVIPEMTNLAIQNFSPDLQPEDRCALTLDNEYIKNIKPGFESLFVKMNFWEIKPYRTQIRIKEDLIYMFNLFEKIDNEGNKIYVQYDCGQESRIIIITPKEIKIRHQFLTDFLASRKLNLVCCVRSEFNMPADSLPSLNFKYTYTGHSGITKKPTPNLISNLSIAITGGEFQNWYLGKKIVPYKKFGEFKSSFDSQYAEFIIGYDYDSCRELKSFCNDKKNAYKRVFFRKGVLEKYRVDINASIKANFISSSFFGLKCDNDRPDYIWTFLKDLCSLPYTEQLHWASYNMNPIIEPPSNFFNDSQISWNASEESPDFIFRRLYLKVNELWAEKFGWELFKPTQRLQENLLERIFLLGNNEPGNFRVLIQSLNIVLTESIDVDNLMKLNFQLPSKKDLGSIMKLNYFLESKGYPKNEFINFLLKIDTIRSEFTDVHRNKSEISDKLSDALSYINLRFKESNYQEASLYLFNRANEVFKWIIKIIPFLNR